MAPQWKADRDLLTTNDSGLRRSAPTLIVVHTSQGDSSADALAQYQQLKSAGGSYHLVVDKTGRAVRENDDAYIPWAAGTTGNAKGMHVCAIGRAEWSRQQWLGRPAQLGRIGEIIRHWSRAYDIPLRKLTAEQVRAGARGVCGHAEVSAAWREVDHWDPGPGFPYDVVLRADAKPVPRPATITVERGDTLHALARRHSTTVDALARANNLRDPDVIRVGQVLKLR